MIFIMSIGYILMGTIIAGFLFAYDDTKVREISNLFDVFLIAILWPFIVAFHIGKALYNEIRW